MAYVFVWDPVKATANVQEHGITFDEASIVFGDPLALLMSDPDHSEGEERYLLPGMSTQHRLLVITFAERSPRTRLISARPATRRERRRYEAKG